MLCPAGPKFMKTRFLSSFRSWGVATSGARRRCAWLGLALLACITTNAQNLLKNPDFEEPLSTNNWTVVYVAPATEEDFMVHGRSSFAHKDASYGTWDGDRSEEHTSELQSRLHLVCRLLLEKKT